MKWIWTRSPSPLDKPKNRADTQIHNAIKSRLGIWEPTHSSREFSRSYIKKLIVDGFVVVDGESITPSDSIQHDQKVEITFPAAQTISLAPQDIPLQFLYEDEDIAVINKPPGLTVHPSPTQFDNTLVNALLFHLDDLSGIGGKLRPGIVHRLDKDTSGALVVTKSDRAHLQLSKDFATHSLERRYWALCYGSVRGDEIEFKLECKVGRNPTDRRKMAPNIRDGKIAITHVHQLDTFSVSSTAKPFGSLIEAKLETGRTHQVRVHLTENGNSLFGDPVYGTPDPETA